MGRTQLAAAFALLACLAAAGSASAELTIERYERQVRG